MLCERSNGFNVDIKKNNCSYPRDHRLEIHNEGNSKDYGHDTDACVAARHTLSSERDETISDLKGRIESHHALHHPLFGYIETTAQSAEFERFVRSEIADELSFGTFAPSSQYGQFPRATGPLHQHWRNKEATDESSSNASHTNTYRDLLRYAFLKLNGQETHYSSSGKPDNGMWLPEKFHKFQGDCNATAIFPVERLIESLQYPKLLRGCLRIEIISKNSNVLLNPPVIGELIDSTLSEVLAEGSNLAIDKMDNVIHFMDWKLGYFDRLFSEILWS